MLQNVIIRLSQLVPLSLRSGLASSSYGSFVRSILNRMSKLVNDPASPLDQQTYAAIIASLQRVQSAMERLQSVKAS